MTPLIAKILEPTMFDAKVYIYDNQEQPIRPPQTFKGCINPLDALDTARMYLAALNDDAASKLFAVDIHLVMHTE